MNKKMKKVRVKHRKNRNRIKGIYASNQSKKVVKKQPETVEKTVTVKKTTAKKTTAKKTTAKKTTAKKTTAKKTTAKKNK